MKGLIIVMLAMLVTLVRNTVMGSFAIFEWIIVFPLVITPGLPIIFFLLSYENAVICGCFGIIYSVYCLIQPWLYWTRTFQGLNPDCDPKYFIYVFIDLYNPSLIRFLKAMSIVACIGGVPVAGISVYYIFQGAFKSEKELREMDDNFQTRFDRLPINTDTDSQLITMIWKITRIFIGFGLLFIGASITAFTEKMLVRNDVDLSDANFESTSQLIPFLVGLFNLVSTLYGSIKHRE